MELCRSIRVHLAALLRTLSAPAPSSTRTRLHLTPRSSADRVQLRVHPISPVHHPLRCPPIHPSSATVGSAASALVDLHNSVDPLRSNTAILKRSKTNISTRINSFLISIINLSLHSDTHRLVLGWVRQKEPRAWCSHTHNPRRPQIPVQTAQLVEGPRFYLLSARPPRLYRWVRVYTASYRLHQCRPPPHPGIVGTLVRFLLREALRRRLVLRLHPLLNLPMARPRLARRLRFTHGLKASMHLHHYLPLRCYVMRERPPSWLGW